METPRLWRQLKRHPESAEYEDIPPPRFQQMVADLKQYGNLTDRKILLFEGQVLDGWQFQRAHVEADIPPAYKVVSKIPKGMTVKDFCDILNSNRRHEPPEKVRERLEERKARILALADAGKSDRAIADELKVPRSTVRRNLGRTPDKKTEGAPAKEKKAAVTGTDGKTYPAGTKMVPDIPDSYEGETWCDKCVRAGAAVCKKCKLLNLPVKPAEVKKAKSGAAYDWKKFEKLFGPILREIDVAGKLFDKKDSEEAQSLRVMLGDWKKRFKEFAKPSK